jgi:hypothetical protein
MPSFLRLRGFALALLLPALGAAPASAGEHRLGFGFHYWKAVSDLADDGFDVEEDGLSMVGSYQYYPGGLIGFELALERFDAGFAGAEGVVYSPQAYLLVGKGLYAGVGVGSNYSDSFTSSFSDPFLAAKAGFTLALLPRLKLDLNANYRFDDWSELDEASSDTVTLGALVRVAF